MIANLLLLIEVVENFVPIYIYIYRERERQSDRQTDYAAFVQEFPTCSEIVKVRFGALPRLNFSAKETSQN